MPSVNCHNQGLSQVSVGHEGVDPYWHSQSRRLERNSSWPLSASLIVLPPYRTHSLGRPSSVSTCVIQSLTWFSDILPAPLGLSSQSRQKSSSGSGQAKRMKLRTCPSV